MSHISKIKTQMIEKDLILQAIQDLGYRFEVGSLELEGVHQQKTQVEIKIISRLGNDIGLNKNKDSYEIIADWWGVLGITQKEFTERLTQRYAYLAVTTQLEKQGFTLASEENIEGKIHLVLRRMA